MEKIMSNLHMERMKCQAGLQFAIDEDKNISDRNSDVVRILMEDGNLIVEEVRPGRDQAEVRGKLKYTILYMADDENRKLCKITGEIPWEEKLRMEGLEVSDPVWAEGRIEDLRSICINSRKINIKALLHLKLQVHETYDESIISEIERPLLEQKKELYDISPVTIYRKDVFRMKEEVELPATLPPVEEVLWKALHLNKWEARPLEDSIAIQGEMSIFVLYRVAGEEEEIRHYEGIIPFSSNLECAGSNSHMITNIGAYPGTWNINVKQDYDGEDRILEAEMALDLPIYLYEHRQVEAITDVYGINEEIKPIFRKGYCKKILEKQQGKLKLTKMARIPASAPKILQICYTDGKIVSAEIVRSGEEEKLRGIVAVSLLYLTDNEQQPFYTLKEEIPFEHTLENNMEQNNLQWDFFCLVQQCKTILLDGEQAEIKVSLTLEVQPAICEERELLQDIEVEEMEPTKRNSLPSMVVYRPASKENIWEIGKKYFVSMEMIRKINQLETEEIEAGQKILLVR